MKTLDDLYKIVEESSHETAFNFGEVDGLYMHLLGLPADKELRIVEVGIEFGRSSTVFFEFQKQNPLWKYTAIDNWSGEYGQKAHDHVFAQAEKHGWKTDIWSMDSLQASEKYLDKIDVLHIDGDHEYEAVLADCTAWMPKVNVGGLAFFDDYGHDSLPGVYKGVVEYVDANPGWEFVERYANKLGLYRRVS